MGLLTLFMHNASKQGMLLPQLRSGARSARSALPLRMKAAEPAVAGSKLTFTQEMRNKAMSLHTFSQVHNTELVCAYVFGVPCDSLDVCWAMCRCLDVVHIFERTFTSIHKNHQILCE